MFILIDVSIGTIEVHQSWSAINLHAIKPSPAIPAVPPTVSTESAISKESISHPKAIPTIQHPSSTLIGLKRAREVSLNGTMEQDACIDEMWKLLTKESFAANPQSLQQQLADIGLTDKELLIYCGLEEITQCSEHLKVIPKRKLLMLFDQLSQSSSS